MTGHTISTFFRCSALRSGNEMSSGVNTKTASADHRPSRRRQSLAPSNLATSD